MTRIRAAEREGLLQRAVRGGTGRVPAAALLAFALAFGIFARSAVAQDTPPSQPYDDQLLRLSEILGAVHYLRELCHAGEGTMWRDQMQALLDSEQPDADRRARFVDRFNRGYQGFRAVYRECTTAATLAIDGYMKEGARIARDVAARYGKEK